LGREHLGREHLKSGQRKKKEKKKTFKKPKSHVNWFAPLGKADRQPRYLWDRNNSNPIYFDSMQG